MNIPPLSPTDDEILVTIQRDWDIEIDAVSYFPAGFGAHHWQALLGGSPIAFITLDQVRTDQEIDEVERAYAATHELSQTGMTFVVAPIPSASGTFTIPIADGSVSITPWLQGRTPTAEVAAEPANLNRTVRSLTQLHQAH